MADCTGEQAPPLLPRLDSRHFLHIRTTFKFEGHDARDQVKVTNTLEQTRFALRWQTNRLDVALTEVNQLVSTIKRTKQASSDNLLRDRHTRWNRIAANRITHRPAKHSENETYGCEFVLVCERHRRAVAVRTRQTAGSMTVSSGMSTNGIYHYSSRSRHFPRQRKEVNPTDTRKPRHSFSDTGLTRSTRTTDTLSVFVPRHFNRVRQLLVRSQLKG